MTGAIHPSDRNQGLTSRRVCLKIEFEMNNLHVTRDIKGTSRLEDLPHKYPRVGRIRAQVYNR